MRRFNGVVLVAALLLPVLLHRTAAGSEFEDKIKAITGQELFKHAHWGMLVADRQTGETLHEENADRLFAPASTTKLFSVAAALDALGADYHFETPIYARGEINSQGELNGDLILVASGDLSLGGRTNSDERIAFRNNDHTYASFTGTAELTEEDPLAGLKDLARQVAAAGVKRVRGDVVIDARLFESARGTGSGPGRLTPIVVNDNVIDFTIAPADEGAAARVIWRPKCSNYSVDAQVDTVKAGGETRVELRRAASGYVVRGQVPAGRKPLVIVDEVDDAAEFARALFIDCLEAAGVHVAASNLSAPAKTSLLDRGTYTGLKRVALFTSPPFAESAKLVLKVSHNLHASTLPLLLAAKHGNRTLADGLHHQRAFLAKAGVDVDSISFGGGAGGDRADYVTPRAAVALLRHMATRDDFPVYRAALPILGVDGTLAEAVGQDSSARGKIQAKTGTLLWSNTMNGTVLLNSKALAGYATTAGGRELVFAMFVNQVSLPRPQDRDKIGQTLGKLCEVFHEEL